MFAIEKFCQSCGLPLTANHLRGTEVTGEPTVSYCHLCYQNGAFTEPNISYTEMLTRGQQGLTASSHGAIKKWLLIKLYPLQLKGLSRWKKQ
ncbi:zinc ribbon domain-containing protein [Brochothrix campestris]|uniref:Putative zinc ribbon domain-containing protein n=1 Tax=Brochothrix campestris FSL F6-1037 TaxID=1265861 RepID=W7D0B9_9LIST|nr:zinc ribbon domain-containing protein [Brochothrix campestris]EUJ41401.1 hypothetical protein BCAMP_03815 [Brochothrix campestris FSL F6-1037]